MRRLLALVSATIFASLAVIACSSPGGGGVGTPVDSGASDSGAGREVSAEGDDASDAATTDAPPTSYGSSKGGSCPGCQVKQCMPELSACGANSTCLDWLKCWNDCYKTSDPTGCQTKCMSDSPTPEGKKLEACSTTKCASECVP
jgi:hypothetical protein